MVVRMIEQAKRELAVAEERLRKLQEQEARAREDVEGWKDFVRRAEGLVASSDGNGTRTLSDEKDAMTSLPNGYEPGKIHVKRDSLAGLCVKLIVDKGPLRLKELVTHLRTMGKDEGIKDFPTALNTALWRRREDLFTKDEAKRYILRTKEIQFVD